VGAMVGGSGISSSVVCALVSTSGIGGVGGIVVMATNGVLHLVHESRHYGRLFVSGYIREDRKFNDDCSIVRLFNSVC
jgi:hypothetical protein